MRIKLFEKQTDHLRLLPLTYTRSVGDLRVGILTIAEKWSHHLKAEVFQESVPELSEKYPVGQQADLIILAGLLPDQELLKAIDPLEKGSGLYNSAGELLVGKPHDHQLTNDLNRIEYPGSYDQIIYPWDLFRLNGQEIRKDYHLITYNRKSESLNDIHTRTYGVDIFIEKGAKIRAAILNAENGPIYIGKNTDIQEGSMIKGPFALCEGAILNMGTKVRGDSTIGPYSKIGGEVSNSVLLGYSNKGHDGFIGNSVLGEWCNLGADTNTSNMKNNYGTVKMWDFEQEKFIDTGLQFCGLIMGDHSKCSINTMFNTGTTVGVSANIFGEGFPRNFIPSFSWGGKHGFITYRTEKVFETAVLAMKRRGKTLTDMDRKILVDIFDRTAHHRNWEKHS